MVYHRMMVMVINVVVMVMVIFLLCLCHKLWPRQSVCHRFWHPGHKKVTLVMIYLTFVCRRNQKRTQICHCEESMWLVFYTLLETVMVIMVMVLMVVLMVIMPIVLIVVLMLRITKAHQNLSPACEGGDMEGNVGENEQGVGVLRKLLQPGHVVLTSEGQVDQEAKIFR